MTHTVREVTIETAQTELQDAVDDDRVVAAFIVEGDGHHLYLAGEDLAAQLVLIDNLLTCLQAIHADIQKTLS